LNGPALSLGGLGIAKNNSGPNSKAIGAWTQNITRQPSVGVISPASTAPDATPVVYPQLISPMHSPRRFLLAISRTKMMDVLIKPPLPQPVTARPTKNVRRFGAAALMKRPIESSVVEKIT
jgi:hypothetical protein